MDNKKTEFLKNLEENLTELPEEERKNALLYYEEFLQDACDSGKDLDEAIEQLGTPQEIVSFLKAEESFYQAQKKPGIKNFNKAMKNVFLGISTPVGIFSRGLLLFIVYCVLTIFLGGTIITFLSAVLSFAGLLYEAFKIPPVYMAERLGTLGIAIFVLSFFFLLSYILFKISRWLMGLAAQTARKMLRKKFGRADYAIEKEEKTKGFNKRLIIASTVLIFAGIILSIASGLPAKYFTIFNSMVPENVKDVVNEYDPADIDKITIKTAHSRINVINDEMKPDKIVLTYEQSDWLNYQSSINGRDAIFIESGNGRLPLFDLVALHESTTALTLHLPENYNANEIVLESRGGFISVDGAVQNFNVKTFTGNIMFDINKRDIPFSLSAATESGDLEVDGVNNNGFSEITVLQQNALKKIKIISDRGNISIK
jgi:uncharacterized membrane protein